MISGLKDHSGLRLIVLCLVQAFLVMFVAGVFPTRRYVMVSSGRGGARLLVLIMPDRPDYARPATAPGHVHSFIGVSRYGGC